MSFSRELHSDDIPVSQGKTRIDSAADLGRIERAPADVLNKDYADALAFNEEPVTIIIQPGSEKNAPRVVDCWVNGKGLELLHDGRWFETGAAPVGRPFTTKRKYVEVIARSKVDRIETRHDDESAENPRNWVERSTYVRAPLSLIEDKNPKGAEWFSRIVGMNA
jgi:hypothetical protein